LAYFAVFGTFINLAQTAYLCYNYWIMALHYFYLRPLLSTVLIAVFLLGSAHEAHAQLTSPGPGPSSGAASSVNVPQGNPFVINETPLQLLQPPDDATTQLPAQTGVGMFFTYFNLAWPWVVGSAAGVAVLQALVGGIQIMLSGGDSGKREEGKNRLLWALAGLLMIGLSGVILETLNPLFYVQV
jgi:hypothetical protein